MKKMLAVLLICAAALLAVSCSATGDNPPKAAPQETASPEPVTVDLDLSVLSGTVVYAQVSPDITTPLNPRSGISSTTSASSRTRQPAARRASNSSWPASMPGRRITRSPPRKSP